MTILVTGGCGFIGSNLVESIPLEHEVIILDSMMRGEESARNHDQISRPNTLLMGNVAEENVVHNVFKKYRPDTIFHLAAQPSNRLALKKASREYFMSNVTSTFNVLEAAKEFGGRIVFASSNKVYGHQPTPHREQMEFRPEGPYGVSKAVSELYLKMYADWMGVKSVAIRFHHAVGKRCHSELVLSIFGEAALAGKPMLANGSFVNAGSLKGWTWCSADFTPVNDVAEGLLLFLDDKNWETKEFRAYNFGTGVSTTVYELARMVKEEFGSNSEIEPRGADSHEGLHHLADVSKAREELGWQSRTGLRTAIREYAAWRKAL